MLIYLVRHGQTDWNTQGRLQGQTDKPLNALGRRQARENGNALAGWIEEGIDAFHFVASPMLRTRQTMEILRSAAGLEPGGYDTDSRLMELSFGDWEGRTLDEIAVDQPERTAAREAGKWDFLPPGAAAESYEILSWRVAAWLKTVDQPTVCVCHGGILRVLLYLVDKVPGDEAASAPTPQDRILRLDEGGTCWL